MKNIKLAFCLALALSCSACSDSEHAKNALEDAGYKNIKTTGYVFFGCSDSDFYHTGFTATAPGSGRTVNGVVCSGFWLKGTTIRTF